jgi:hypothetical protein
VATGPFFDERTAPPVAIRTPSPGAVFLSADGEAIVHAAANREKGRWFLDGRAAANGGRLRLSLPRGRHELRFLTPSGDTAAVRFVVR